MKYVHLLFLTIAEHELNIEELRLDISASESFNPKAIFNYIDEELDGKITVDELQ